MVRWVRRAPAMLAWICLTGMLGCHAVPRGLRPDDLAPGHGRVDRPVPVTIGTALRATMATLDEQGVRPKKLVINTLTEDPHQQGAIAIDLEATNAAMVPAAKRFDDLFVRHQLTAPDGRPTPFVPRLVTYKGEAADRRAVVVTIASSRDSEADQLVTVRVGPTGDPAWSRAFLDKVAARAGGEPGPTAPVNPTVAP